MTVRMLCDYPPYKNGDIVTLASAVETALVAQHMADTNTSGGTTYVAPVLETGNGWIPLKTDKTLKAEDDGKTYYATVPLNITVPLGLIPQPAVIVQCPPTGVVTFIGLDLINDSAQSLTRAKSANPAGVALTPRGAGLGYGLGGV